jgi:tetratricopeptide (TPR) repeat protein
MENVGLGFFLGGGGNPQEFGHDGDDEGFQAQLIMFADSGKGVAIMTNSNNGLSMASFLLASVAKEYGWHYTMQQNPVDILWLVANARGTAVAIQKYEDLKKSSPKGLDENTLLQVAYQILFAGKTDDAIDVFKLQVRDYPKYWNSYDSIGEAYMKAGQKDLAIANYEKSIELKPDNQNGIDRLKKLRQQQ